MSEEFFAFPLSFSQQRLWFLDQLVPGNPFYNLHVAVPFQVPLNVPVLQRAVNEIVGRHESLRTTFASVDEAPVQRIAETLVLELPVVDLRSLDSAEREQEARRLAAEEAVRPFDLAAGPLVRVGLLRRGERDWLFLLTLHHIVADGWSLAIFFDELSKLYSAFLLGQRSPLPELAVQYADFAVWQRDWLQGEKLGEQMDYWRGQLSDLPVLEFPTDRPRPPVASYRGAQQPVSIPASLAAALRAFSRREDATLFMTMLAAFQALLARCSGQDDIVVGVPVAGRNRTELEGLIGFFINTLVMRADLSGDPPFREFLRRVKAMALGAYAHQDLPFEKLVEELQPERDLARNPLFQVTFQLLATAASSAGGGAAPPAAERGAAVFDLAFNLFEGPDGIAGHIEYGTDLFDAASIERLAAHYLVLLEGIVADPSQRTGELPLLSSAELRLMLEEWNSNSAELPPATVTELFRAQAARAPDALAIACGAKRMSYAQLDRATDRLAATLAARGTGAEEVVAICLERSPALVVAMLGALKAGAAYLPLDPASPGGRLAFMLDDSGAKRVITSSSLAQRLAGVQVEVLLLGDEPIDAGEGDHACPAAPQRPDGLAYVIYTSGSTGEPKGVEIEHRGLSNLIAWHRRAYGVSAADRASQIAGPAFDACGWEIWPYLASGASVHIVDEALRADAPALLDWMTEQAITVSFLPTPLAELVLEQPMPQPLALRALLTGGDRLHRWPRPGLPFTVFNNYGPTEYSVVTTWTPLDPREASEGYPPIGRPIDNTALYVLDARGQPVPIGVWGELHVGGAGLARGYRNRPELTAEKFVANPLGTGPDRLYRTGDRARWRADGRIEFQGRTDFQAKIRGYRVEPGEIEAVLGSHAGVREAAVLACEDAGGERRLVAYVVARPGAGPDTESLRAHAAARLPEYMVPASFVLLDAMPLTPNGKIDRGALPAPGEGSGAPAGAAPRSEVEETLALIWKDVLQREDVGIFDNFFTDLGGHSLLATQLASRVRASFDIELPLRRLFAAPTIAALAEAVEEILLAEIEALSDEQARRLVAG